MNKEIIRDRVNAIVERAKTATENEKRMKQEALDEIVELCLHSFEESENPHSTYIDISEDLLERTHHTPETLCRALTELFEEKIRVHHTTQAGVLSLLLRTV